MISHQNVITNILQIQACEMKTRNPYEREIVLGMMPQSHIYGLVVICHAKIYTGDCIISFPRFDMTWMLQAIPKYRIKTLFLVGICYYLYSYLTW